MVAKPVPLEPITIDRDKGRVDEAGMAVDLGSVKASDLMEGVTAVATFRLIIDWRSRLGLRVMRLGARIMRATLEARHASEG